MDSAQWANLPRCGQPTRSGKACQRFAGKDGSCGRHRPGSSPISPAAAPAPDRPLVAALAALVATERQIGAAEATPANPEAFAALAGAVRRVLAGKQARNPVDLVLALDALEVVYARAAVEADRLDRLAQLRAERLRQLDAVADALDSAGVTHTEHDADAVIRAASTAARHAAARRPGETEPAGPRKKRAAGLSAYGSRVLARALPPARVVQSERDAPLIAQ